MDVGIRRRGIYALYCGKLKANIQYICIYIYIYIISNKDLWKVTRQEDINVEIKKRKFGWIGHTLRKEDGEIPKAALLWNLQGNRRRGRPRNSWRRSVIKEAGKS